MQVGEKERSKKRDYQNQMYELRASKLAEIDYNNKVQAQTETNKRIVSIDPI
jgi:hypothetical protein